MKALPYQFGLPTISSFREHLNVTRTRTNQNQLVNIYLMIKSHGHKTYDQKHSHHPPSRHEKENLGNSRKVINNTTATASGNLYLEPGVTQGYSRMKRRHSSYDASQDEIPPPLPPHQGTVV